MASIVADSSHLEAEEMGETTLELIALRYTGSRSSLSVANHLNNEGSWPAMATIQGATDENGNSVPGPWYYALVPDEGLAHLENRPDVEVMYATERDRFAEALLEERRLPRNVFGVGANSKLRDRVFDTLGLVPEVEGGRIRDQLRDIAGVEPDEDTGEQDSGGLKNDLMDKYDRAELGAIAKELREDSEDFDLRANQGKNDRAEFIANADEDDRAAAIAAADVGGDD